jgi:hypothetical protein
MHAVAWAFAWEFWSRHRVVMALSAGYLLVLVALIHVLPAGALEPGVIVALSLPLWGTVPYLIAAFAYGDKADVLARESAFPRRAFTLPLGTPALVGWPMAVGVVAVTSFWLALAGLVLGGTGAPIPLFWLSAFLAALLVWVQALTWWPFPLPALRIFVAVPVLGAMASGAILGLTYHLSPAVLLAASAGLVPAGYLVAVAGVARARRGDTSARQWRLPWRRAAAPVPVRPPFASPEAALGWLEWRGNLFLMPLMVALVVVPQGLLVYFVDNPRATPFLLLALGVYPLVNSFTAGAVLGSTHPWARHVPAIPAFLAARPVTTGTFIAVKLRTALVAALGTWALILVAVLVLLPAPHVREALFRGARFLVEDGGPVKGGASLLVIVLGPSVLSWKAIVDQLWVGLAGRNWINLVASLAFAVGITVAGLVLAWVYVYPEVREPVQAAVPWAVGVLLALKLGAGLLVARGLVRCNLMTPRTVACLAALWVAAAAGLAALAYWLTPPELAAPGLVAGSAVLIGLPLVRLGLAPLALDWNRHR